MALLDLDFSDLILLPNGTGMLKGGESGEQLMPVPGDCLAEIADLPTRLTSAVLEKTHPDPNTGMRVEPITFRFSHSGIQYRVADMYDVYHGRTWFLRRLADKVPALPDVGLLPYVTDWLSAPEQRQGLVLFSGPQASGKTTSASALVAARLTRYGGHSVTFENPAELPLAGPWGDHGHCFQTEISGEKALAAEIEKAHRYAAPNIILIGEIRTRYAAVEALRIALGSGHQIVVATIHGLDVCAALDRLANWAKEEDGDNAYRNLATSLLAIVHQEIQCIGGKRVLRTPHFLLVPFTEQAKGIRSKLRENKIFGLSDDMREQKNRISAGLGVA